MFCLVLDSHVGSEYNDSPSSYEFPTRYLKLFEPLGRGEPLIAIIYEPKGHDRSGRMAYVGWAPINQPPHPTGRRNDAGQHLWAVDYVGGYKDFARSVPREVGGQPVESWLAALPAGNRRSIAQLGNAVRPLPLDEAQLILNLGLGTERAAELAYPTAGEVLEPALATRERVDRLVRTIERDASFRSSVLGSYEYQCSVSGFAVEGVRPGRITSLIDAAHVRPVAQDGSDDVSNGIALTPTLHRLFDEGLFTLQYSRGALRVRTSGRLEDPMIIAPDASFRLPLRDGIAARLPARRDLWPDESQLRFHRQNVFRPS